MPPSVACTRGVDYKVAYDFELDDVVGGDYGGFTATLAGNYLDQFKTRTFAGIDTTIEQRQGEFDPDEGAFFEHLINGSLGWRKGPWTADYGFKYVSDLFYVVNFLNIDRESQEANQNLIANGKTGDGFVHYLGGTYDWDDRVTFSVRVNNLTDRDPFRRIQNRGEIRPTSLIGRTVLFGVNARF